MFLNILPRHNDEPAPPGKSAYEIWREVGHNGSPQDFLDSLKGSDVPSNIFIQDTQPSESEIKVSPSVWIQTNFNGDIMQYQCF